MDLFELNGRVVVNLADALKAFDEIQQEGQKTQSKLGKFFSGVGKGAAVMGKTIGVGMVAAGTAVAGLVGKATSAYAEYEQLVGGVDTLFGESSAKVQAYAEKAYETAGMSANEYMNTVTSFSASLLQSLGGDTEKAADQADKAIRDMSDNANKMGTSMEMIQNAYQGFAKQNYTMLDNLKLGYGGTKEEMQRLLDDASKLSGQKFDISSYSDVVEAIHVVQKEMGITGTTADEAAGTISGSMNSVKGAWTNLVTAMASDDLPLDEYVTKFVESASTMVGNMLPRIEKALGGVVQLIDQVAPVILAKVPELLSQLLPSVIEAATGIIDSIVNILPDLVQAVVDMLPALIEGFVTLINGIIGALPAIVDALMSALPTLIPLLVDGLVAIIVALCGMLTDIIQPIIDHLPDIIISIVDAIANNLPILIEGLIALIIGIVEALPEIIQGLIDALPMIIEAIVAGLFSARMALIEGAIKLVFAIAAALPQIMSSLQEALPKAFLGIWNGIKKIFSTTNVGGFFKSVWESITRSFGSVTDWFRNKFSEAWQAVKNVFSTGGKVFDGIKDGIANVFTTTVNAIIGGINKVIAVPFNALNGVLERIKNIEIAGLSPFTWVHTLTVPEIPKLQWNAKAMDNPRIFDKPTIYGYNPSAGAYQGVGEAGSEVVSGTDTLMNMIASAVASQNATLVAVLNKILEAILGMDENMGENLRDALDGVSLGVNKREFARLVKGVN